MKQGKGIKRFFTKKNVFFAVAFLLVASLTAAFIVSCNHGGDQPGPDGPLTNQDSTMLKTPTDGTSPTDYDAKSNAYYAMYAMSQLTSFTTQSVGDTVTKVAFASVSQKIKGNRVVNNGEIYKQNVSHSKFRSVGVQTFVKGTNYVVRNASKVSSVEEVKWEQTASRVSEQTFLSQFGYVPNSITSYVLSDETILSAQYLGEENGVYSFYYQLDPVKSTTKLCLEMRTMAGNNSLPVFEKAAITVRMNKDWQVLEVVTDSVYEVDMLGGVTCTESVVETFSNFNKGVEVPNASFFHSYLDADITEPAPVTLTATDYLMTGFADYVSGAKPLNLSANVAADNLCVKLDASVALNMENLSATTASINVKDLSYQDVKIKDVALFYENSNVYLNVGKFKAVTTVDEISDFASKFGALFNVDVLSSFEGLDFASLDIESLISGATLEETETVATVLLPLTLGDTTINARIDFTKGEKIAVTQIAATIGEVEVAVTVNDDLVLPQKGDGYNAITPLLQAIDENVALQLQVGDVTAVANINLKTLQVDAYVDNLVLGDVALQDVKAKVANNTIYADVLGLKAKLSLDDVQPLLDKLSFVFGDKIALPNMDALQSIDMMALVAEAINSLASQQTQDGLSISLSALGLDFNLLLTITQQGYALGNVAVDVEGTNVVASLFEGEVPAINNDELASYNNVATLLDVIEDNQINLKVNALGLDVDLNVDLTNFTILAKTTLYGETLYAKIAEEKVYVSYKGLNGYVALADLEKVLDKLGVFIGEIKLPDFSKITAEEVINSLTVTDNEVITIGLSIAGINANVVLDKTNGLTLSSVTATLQDTEIVATPSTKADYTGMTATEYYNLATLLDVIEDNQINLKVNALGLDVDLNVDLTNFTILAKTTLYGETLYAKIAEEKVHVSYKGLNGYVVLADLEKVLDKLGVFIGEIELPDFSKITAEEVISSLTVTDTDVVTIALNLCGINANVVLDKANGLTLSSVTATLQDTEIVATPSTKADYAGMTATEYYNLVTLLDVIDENGKISLQAQAFGATIYATIDLPNNQILAQLDDLQVLVDLTQNVAYARYPGANLKLNLDEIEVVLKELEPIITKFITPEEFNSINLEAFKNIKVEDVISSIVVTQAQDTLNLSLAIAEVNATVALDKAQNGLVVAGGNIKMGAIEIPFTMGVEPLDFAFDKAATYIGVTELVQTFAPALKNILTLDNLYANMTATLVLGNKVFELTECEVLIANIYSAPKARANVTLKITTNNDDGTTSVAEHKITLFYLDPSLVGEGQVNTYFTYDNTADADVFAGTFTTVNFHQTMDIIKQIYANMPEMQEALKPFIVSDENGMPKFMDIDVNFSKLINSALFANGILSADINGKAILSDLPGSVLLNLFSQDGLLCLDVDDLAFDDAIINLDARVGEAPSGVITEDKFEFAPLSTASDFSSINELLLALKNTSAKRHFYIDAKIDLAGTGLLSFLNMKDKITIKLYLDVVDSKTYFKAVVERKDVNLIVMSVWKDVGGTGTIYFDPDTQMIYVHNHYTVKGGSWLRPTYTEHDEYLKYTVDEFMVDPLTAIFDILRVSDSLRDLINGETSDESTTQSVATIENTFKSYSYNGTDTFNITLDLAPLTTDIKTATVAIKHDSSFNLSGLNATVNMIDILDLKLSATLQTSDVSYGTDVAAKAIASDPNFN